MVVQDKDKIEIAGREIEFVSVEGLPPRTIVQVGDNLGLYVNGYLAGQFCRIAAEGFLSLSYGDNAPKVTLLREDKTQVQPRTVYGEIEIPGNCKIEIGPGQFGDEFTIRVITS
jgi:hypothetical protein